MICFKSEVVDFDCFLNQWICDPWWETYDTLLTFTCILDSKSLHILPALLLETYYHKILIKSNP